MGLTRTLAAAALAVGLTLTGAASAQAESPNPTPPPSKVLNSEGLSDMNLSVTHLNMSTTSLKRATSLLHKATKALYRGNEKRAAVLASQAEVTGGRATAAWDAADGYMDIALLLHETAAQKIRDEGGISVDSPSWMRAMVRAKLASDLHNLTVVRARAAEDKYCDALATPGQSVVCATIVN